MTETRTVTQKPRIVVGIDGSPSSSAALRSASQLAPLLGATIDAVTAWHMPTAYGMAYIPSAFDIEGDYEKVLGEVVDGVFAADRPPGLRLVVREGAAARVILDVAEGAALIVVGSRGHGQFAGLLLGSVSTRVAEHADCPVLIVHGDGNLTEVPK